MIKKSFSNQNPTLFVIATPIGNMDDITKRAIVALSKIQLLLCENIRKANFLLSRLKIKTKPKLLKYDIVNENKITIKVMELFTRYEKIGLISNAGSPLISDPGFPLIKFLQKTKINLVVIPGAIAYTTALIASSFPINNFFGGFIPHKTLQRKKIFSKLKDYKTTLIFYVSCHKLIKVFEELELFFSKKELFLAKELTKIHETYYYGLANEIIKDLPPKPKGEYVLLINNN